MLTVLILAALALLLVIGLVATGSLDRRPRRVVREGVVQRPVRTETVEEQVEIRRVVD